MKTKFQVKSPKNGRLYRLAAEEIQAFYNEHVLGNVSAFRDKVMKRIKASTGKYPTFPLVGTVLCRLTNSEGQLAGVSMGGNLVVDTGRSAAIDRLQGTSVGVHDYVGIGTDSTSPVVGNTALGGETGTRVQGTLSQPTAYTDRVVSTFAAGNGTATIAEAGRFSASVAGNMFARYVFTGIPKGASDSLEITYDITD